MKELGNSLLKILESIRDGKIVDAYLDFENKMDDIWEQIPKSGLSRDTYYRMRAGKDLKRRSQLYPLPPELRHFSGRIPSCISQSNTWSQVFWQRRYFRRLRTFF